MDRKSDDPVVENMKGKMTPEEYQAYLKEREMLVKVAMDQALSLDKYLLTFSAGAFGLALAFLDRIIPEGEIHWLFLLFGSWAAFVICMGSVLWSIRSSQRALDKAIDDLPKRICQKGDCSNPGPEPQAKLTRGLNLISLLAFFAGVVLLAIFSGLSLAERSSQMADGPKKGINEGFVPPPSPVPPGDGNRGLVPPKPPIAPPPPPAPAPEKK